MGANGGYRNMIPAQIPSTAIDPLPAASASSSQSPSVPNVVLGSPVSRLEKNRDWTGTEPEMTGKLMDRKRPRPRSGPRSNRFEKIDGPIKNRSFAVKICRLIKL
jgi:hypothetical protein